ncbi:MAG: GNAT family N-acetyltransferase [Flavobacteriaceae bacterium]
MVVRKATKEDMPQVLGLIKELAVFEKEPEAVVITLAELEAAGFGDNPQFTCFVAEMNSEIVGMALVYFRFSTWVGNTVHLEDLIVKEHMRGKGIGIALYKKVMEYSKAQGVKRVNWMVLGWNKDAIAFYENTGAKVLEEWWQVEMNQTALDNFLSK